MRDTPSIDAKAKTPLSAYEAALAAGEVKPDAGQAEAARALDDLFHALQDYRPERRKPGLLARLGLAREADPDAPKGLYIHGPVGRGKSMLMDLFHDLAPVEKKRRVHFHAFMAEVHEKLHRWRKATAGKKADPLPELAAALAEDAWLISFDEFHVVNIADAMILSRFFEALFERGVVVVATSNWPPERLYESGLQRENFLPFIDLVKERMAVVDIGAGTDYRLARLRTRPVYYSPLGPHARAALDKIFHELTAGAAVERDSLLVKGRRVPVPKTARGAARFSFADLCERALGAEDYLALARTFHSVVLDDVPVLTTDKRNEARRFMTLIDQLYEHRCNLIVSAEALPERLYPEGHGSLEFQRTVSRLQEMQAKDYIERPHTSAEAA